MTDPLTDLTAPSPSENPAPDFAERLRSRVRAIEARADRSARAPRSTAADWHLAQLNLGLFKMPLDAPEMAPFVDSLDRINAIADDSPGFIWRLQGDDGEPSSYVEVPGATDPLIASNLSVWTGLEALRDFMYKTDHASYMRRRAEWFNRATEPMIVAWWIPAGTTPTLADAVRRLEHLREHGATDEGFPLGRTIPAPPTHLPPPNPPHDQETPMSTQTLIPYLAVKGARDALQFYAEVFGAEQSGELFEMDDGRIGHSEMNIGDQIFYMSDEFPEMNLHQPGTERMSPVAIVINVDDCDAVYDHALAAGATADRPPSDQHGHRSAWFVDPWGHRWSPTSAAKADAAQG